MKLFWLSVQYKGSDGKVNRLCAATELTSFGYFQRSSVQEFMEFTSKIVTERTSISQRAAVKEQDYLCHVYVRHDSLAGVLISDQEYPARVSQTLLTKVLDEFTEKYTSFQWPSLKDSDVSFSKLDEYLKKYQNPAEADAMTKLQTDIDETKIILHNTIEAVLERGEKLDDLVSKSDDLSAQSKTFYKTAKKTNSCCVIL